MNIIDAHWDKKNLGVKTYEVIFSDNDTINDFVEVEKDLIQNKKAKYLVLKIPANNSELLFGLPKLAYNFVEASMKLTLRKSNYHCPKFVARFDRNITVSQSDNMEAVLNEINKGVFATDRISVDPNFSQEIANRRYSNWIKTLVDNGDPLYEVYLNKDPIGFFLLKRVNEKEVQGILTGLYEKYAKSGYGALIMKKLNDTVWDLGYTTYHAQVVSNNISALKTNLLFGSSIDSITYCYVKNI